MIGDLKLTIYDILGYLFPGLILICSPVWVFWSISGIMWPLSHLGDSFIAGLGLLVLIYIAGHVAQFIGEWISRGLGFDANRIIEGEDDGKLSNWITSDTHTAEHLIDNPLLERIRSEAEIITGLRNIDNRTLFVICDESMVSTGGQIREMLEYREGFHRGCYASFLALALTFLVSPVFLWSRHFYGLISATAFVICLVLTYVFFKRYMRVAEARVRHVLVGFLVRRALQK